MTSESAKFLVPPLVEPPRGSIEAGVITALLLEGMQRLARAGAAVWRALQNEGQRRAARELRETAARWEHTHPEIALQLRDAARFDSLA